MASRSTLTDLHGMWTKYAETYTWSPNKRATLKERFLSHADIISQQKRQRDVQSSRWAGPAWTKAAYSTDPMKTVAAAEEHYRQTGVTFTERSFVRAVSHLNPTFALAGDGQRFVCPRQMSPPQVFHLALALVPALDETAPPYESFTIKKIFDTMHLQFSVFCDAFRRAVSSSNVRKVVIRAFVGDALALCYALREVGETSGCPRVSQWRAPLVRLDGPGYLESSDTAAPRKFDVIDTSRLCDHVGTFNILTATSPLLAHTPSATLYTQTLFPYGDKPTSAFLHTAGGDMTTMAVLFDLVPTSYISRLTTQSNVHELVPYHALKEPASSPFNECRSWKRPSQLGSPGRAMAITFEVDDFAQLLFRTYMKIYKWEDNDEDKSPTAPHHDRGYYSQRAFALLLATLMDRITVDWDAVLAHFLSDIKDDTRPSRRRAARHDLFCQLYVHGIFHDPFLVSAPAHIEPFDGWDAVPPVVCVAFPVPRSALRILADASFAAGAPLVAQTGLHSIQVFSGIEMCFGTLRVEGSGARARGTLAEDPRGRPGAQDAVVWFDVPACMFADFARVPDQSFALAIETHPGNFAMVMTRTAMNPVLHEVFVRDRGRTMHILPCRPTVAGETCPPPTFTKRASVQRADDAPKVVLDAQSGKIKAFSRRVAIADAAAKAVFASQDTPVSVWQVAPCEMRLDVGSTWSTNLVFPYVIDGPKSQLRIARRSSWVEVSLGASSPVMRFRHNPASR